MKPIEIMLKHYKPAGPRPPELQAVINRYPVTKLFLDRLGDIFGPCDITVVEEPRPEAAATFMFKLVYAYNHYTERINKAEEYFRTAPADQAAKFRPVYDELLAKAAAAYNEINGLKGKFPYCYEETAAGFIKIYSAAGKEIRLNHAA